MSRDQRWLRTARHARRLSYFSLLWMLAEGVLGLIAGAEAHSIGVIAWGVGSALEAAAAVIVIVHLTGNNRFSDLLLRVPLHCLFESVLGKDAFQRVAGA